MSLCTRLRHPLHRLHLGNSEFCIVISSFLLVLRKVLALLLKDDHALVLLFGRFGRFIVVVEVLSYRISFKLVWLITVTIFKQMRFLLMVAIINSRFLQNIRLFSLYYSSISNSVLLSYCYLCCILISSFLAIYLIEFYKIPVIVYWNSSSNILLMRFCTSSIFP